MPSSGKAPMGADRFELVSDWRLDAPMEEVWQVLSDAERWPAWWPCVEAVEKLDPGEPTGEHSVWRYTWKTMLPYKLQLELCVTRIEAPVLLEADVSGDVSGRGVCRLDRQDNRTIVRYEWNVRICRSWMRWFAPIARPLFLWNHRMVMKQGAVHLAAWLAQHGGKPTIEPGEVSPVFRHPPNRM